MLSRREIIKQLGLLSLGLTSILPFGRALAKTGEHLWVMPEESVDHMSTWVGFIADEAIWSPRQIPEVQRKLISIATRIAKYEPVSLLVRQQDYTLAKELLSHYQPLPFTIELIVAKFNDLWLRDTGPTFVFNKLGQRAAINFNFNGWGGGQVHELDAKLASFIARQTGTKQLISSLTLEGGCFEVDGEGTAIMSESCILNTNRNPGRAKSDVERELKALLGLDKIIWLKGIKGKDITDGHTDFYVRFAKPGVVLVHRDNDPNSFDYQVTRENIKRLSHLSDAKGRALDIHIIDGPQVWNTHLGTSDFAAGYIGYYVCNNAVIMPKFGDTQADEKARKVIAQHYPDRQVEQIRIDGIASGGGSIHCATQQEPATYWRM